MAVTITGTGPTALRTFAFPDNNATILTSATAVTAAQGGTGQTSYTTGDLLYASGASALSKLAIGASGTVLVGGASPSWTGALTLTTSLSIGTLPASTGAIRLANNATICFRDQANGTDVLAIQFDTSNELELRTLAGHSFLFFNGATQTNQLNSAGTFYANTDNTSDLGGASPFRWRSGYFGTSIAIGTSPATTGAIRLATKTAIYNRDAGNTIDQFLIGQRSDGYQQLSDPTTLLFVRGQVFPETTAANVVLGNADANAWAQVGTQKLALTDGITAPAAGGGTTAYVYIDNADGDFKIKFADGVVKTIATDT